MYKIKKQKHKKGSTIIELIIVTMLFTILVPASLGIFVSGKKITGQGYIQHSAAITLGETNDILKFMKNQGFELLENGSFYLIRNPGSDSWLVKNTLPDKDVFERFITVSNALRHQDTNNIFFESDTGDSYEDPDTKKIEIKILWAPDYIASDITTQTLYLTNWRKPITYND